MGLLLLAKCFDDTFTIKGALLALNPSHKVSVI